MLPCTDLSRICINYLLNFAACTSISMQFDVQRLSSSNTNEALESFGNIEEIRRRYERFCLQTNFFCPVLTS